MSQKELEEWRSLLQRSLKNIDDPGTLNYANRLYVRSLLQGGSDEERGSIGGVISALIENIKNFMKGFISGSEPEQQSSPAPAPTLAPAPTPALAPAPEQQSSPAPTPALAPAPTIPTAPPAPATPATIAMEARSDVLADIREGKKLKKVTKEDKSNRNGLESPLQQAMAEQVDLVTTQIQTDIEDNVDCFAFNTKPKECKEEKRCEWRKDSEWEDDNEFGCFQKEQTGGFDRYLMAFKK